MPVIFLSENNSLSKKVIKKPLPQSDACLIEIPFKKLRKRSVSAFREKLAASDSFVFSEPALKSLTPERKADVKAFFDFHIIDILKKYAKQKKLLENRLVLFNPTESIVLSAINIFPDIALAGDNILHLANHIYTLTGAAIPLVSGTKDSDIVLCTKEHSKVPALLIFGFDIEPGENSIGGASLKFYPKGNYASILSLSHRPLNLNEAALLSEYDAKATFNIVF